MILCNLLPVSGMLWKQALGGQKLLCTLIHRDLLCHAPIALLYAVAWRMLWQDLQRVLLGEPSVCRPSTLLSKTHQTPMTSWLQVKAKGLSLERSSCQVHGKAVPRHSMTSACDSRLGFTRHDGLGLSMKVHSRTVTRIRPSTGGLPPLLI